MPRYEWNEAHQTIELIPGTVNYRSKWACFTCRKSFTRVRSVTVPEDVVCPDCKTKATDMGHLFKPPSKRDIRRWKIMEILGRNNFSFRDASNVIVIEHFITDHGKCSPQQAEQNVIDFLGPSTKIK
jgi:DNA-directed RNA polymerase subunit RPC12/RpoP